MNKKDDNYRYHPYHRTKNYNDHRYDDDGKRHSKKTNAQHYSYSSARYDDRMNNQPLKDVSYRRAHRNDYHKYQHLHTNSANYTAFSTPPPPLMSAQFLRPVPVPPPSPLVVIPHERESWIRSVKKTKTNESTEQKTQYLETMLRMPQQQKPALPAARFDRIRFADDQSSAMTNTTAATVSGEQLADGSFHLICDIDKHGDILTLEKILFNAGLNRPKTPPDDASDPVSLPALPPSMNECDPVPRSGFLIDDCEEEEVPPRSPSPPPPPPVPSVSDPLQPSEDDIIEGREQLVSELDAADADQRQESKRQKRLNRKLRKKKNAAKKLKTKREESATIEPEQVLSAPENHEEHESLSDWIIEYDVPEANPVSQLADEVRRTSIGMTDEERAAKVNLILVKIKKQQGELKKLRQYVMSMLGDQQKRPSTKTNRTDADSTQDLLMAFLNQSNQSGCWLCSGKMFAEVGVQSDDTADR